MLVHVLSLLKDSTTGIDILNTPAHIPNHVGLNNLQLFFLYFFNIFVATNFVWQLFFVPLVSLCTFFYLSRHGELRSQTDIEDAQGGGGYVC